MALSSLAYQMLVVAVGWQVYDLTNSAMSLGLIGLMQFTPQFLLTLVVGHVADRYDRRLIVMMYMTDDQPAEVLGAHLMTRMTVVFTALLVVLLGLASSPVLKAVQRSVVNLF